MSANALKLFGDWACEVGVLDPKLWSNQKRSTSVQAESHRKLITVAGEREHNELLSQLQSLLDNVESSVEIA